MQYRVLSTIMADGKDIKAGEKIDLDETAEATAAMLKDGTIEPEHKPFAAKSTPLSGRLNRE